ncbi:Glycosyltransferase involved in cell wall bisynthesis [Formosa sp. Hel1_31_208]|uniref:glycosyltransferase n=1 Tax=Formosa sp. Hel1_31_208 TaxID=1798225 RepID=UPI00087BA7AD|nr:glycosyltransferase [Formosa sp. Hel1_31_208]SDS37930.1 Glycosyltransferase involved in cell wall bisynthesis [Formosa sp. Hel1_31_208]
MKKGVFIYSNFDFSVKNAGVTRMLYYAQALANKNTAVYLLTCSASPIHKNTFKEIHPNVFILKDNNITQSFFGTFRFIKNIFKFSKARAEEQSFLFYPSPLVYLEIIALFYLKFLKKCNVYYELNEIRKYTSTFHEKTSIKRPKYSIKKIIYIAVFSTLEWLLPHYDGLICISTAIQTYGDTFNRSTIRIPILTNPDLKKEFSSEIYSQKDAFNIGFSGSIHPIKENLTSFFNVLGELKKNDYPFAFNLCGYIDKEHHHLLFEQIAKELNISEHINFYGHLNAKELSTFLNQQQLLVIPRGFTLQNNYGFSTKLSDYLDHGKPVLVTDVSDNHMFIKDGVNGFIVPTDDNNKMYDKLVYIMTNYNAIYDDIQKNANETSRNSFYYENYSKSLRDFLFKASYGSQHEKNVSNV